MMATADKRSEWILPYAVEGSSKVHRGAERSSFKRYHMQLSQLWCSYIHLIITLRMRTYSVHAIQGIIGIPSEFQGFLASACPH